MSLLSHFGLLGGFAFSQETCLGLLGLLLLEQSLLFGVFSLILMDEFNQHTLVLVHVTLALEVELVVLFLVDLLSLTVLLQQSTQHTRATHPQDLGWHTSLTGSLSLTSTSVTSLTLRS